jgi:DNA polymerase
MLVGEAPGREEDLKGLPFVGRAGRLLDKALLQAGLERSEVFITSVVKCRPPENRKPKK